MTYKSFVVFEGNGQSEEALKVAERFGFSYVPSLGWISQMAEIQVLNLDGRANGRDYDHLVIISVWFSREDRRTLTERFLDEGFHALLEERRKEFQALPGPTTRRPCA